MVESEGLPARSKLPRSEFDRATRHLFLCVGPDCCDPALHAGLWDQLKTESKRLAAPVFRTKAACLRICTEGPWLVIYPEGIWYGRLNPERLRRILKEHVDEGHPVTEWIAAQMPSLAHLHQAPAFTEPKPEGRTPP